jgi:hypothetical protein
LNGSPGEFISSGKKIVLSSPSAKMTMDQGGPGSITLTVESGPTSWEVELSTPDGSRFTKRKYDGAQRNAFKDSDRPGLNVSGGAHGCNDVKGSFAVSDVGYDANGRLTQLSAAILQYCDDSRSPLNASIAVRAVPSN